MAHQLLLWPTRPPNHPQVTMKPQVNTQLAHSPDLHLDTDFFAACLANNMLPPCHTTQSSLWLICHLINLAISITIMSQLIVITTSSFLDNFEISYKRWKLCVPLTKSCEVVIIQSNVNKETSFNVTSYFLPNHMNSLYEITFQK